MKLGLKLWSVNTDAYLREAVKLHARKVFDYLEIYFVPGSEATAAEWKLTGIPCIVHAPHSRHGVNLAAADHESYNRATFAAVRKFADALSAPDIIAHGGVLGSVAEIVRQLKLIGDPRILIENKPYLPIDRSNVKLAGSTPEEVAEIIAGASCGFCLDIGHMVASANAHAADWCDYFKAFLALKPKMFHLSDLQADSDIDQHLHFGRGALPIREALTQLPPDAVISIETARDSKDGLDDFERDALFLLSESAKCRSQAYDLYGLHFRPMEERDLEPVRLQRNRPEMMALMTTDHEITQEETRHWFANLPATSRYWMVEWEGRVVGQINLKECEGTEAESGFIFWDDDFKKCGRALRAVLALYGLAFESFGVTNLHGTVSPANDSALRTAYFFGFKETGSVVVNGRTFIKLELTVEDFKAAKGRCLRFLAG